MKKRVSVENLAFGMYVSELDRPWAGTPFLFQGFFLRTQEQLDVLRQHCRAVYIDLSKNTSKVYCSQTCAHRQSVAAFRARKRADRQPARPDNR